MEEKKVSYYLIWGKTIAKQEKTGENRSFYLFRDGKWVEDSGHVVLDHLWGFDPSEPEDSPYRIGSTSILAEMESAYELGIDTVTIHPGLVNLAVHDVRQRSLDAARLSMREFDRAAREYGIHACIENMPDIPIMICQSASELEQVIDGTSLEVCFDIGHANTAGQIDAMIDLFRDRIANIHIHDNLGDRDAHLTIGDGNIDFGHVLGRLKGYARRYIIECRNLDSARVSLARLKDMLQ